MVLVHGFRLISQEGEESSLNTIETALRRREFATHRFAYRAKDDTVQGHACALASFILGIIGSEREVALVSNSFGGLLIRAALNTPLWNSKAGGPVELRCVMLAPPSQGSALARVLRPQDDELIWSAAVNFFSRTVLGTKAGRELASLEPGATALLFGPLPDYCKALVIAGDVGKVNPLLEGPNDGVVSVAETLLDSPHSHLTLTATHNLIAEHPAAVRAVLSFLASEPVAGVKLYDDWRNK